MTSRITFNPADQRDILSAADSIVTDLEHLLPKVPWFSNSGQQDAFRNTVQMVTEKASQVDADDASKEAMVFWILTLLYANRRTFRLATASVKNWGTYGISPIAAIFLDWVGSNVPPVQIIAQVIGARQAITSGVPEKIMRKTLEIAQIRGVTPEDASTYFQELFNKSSEKFKCNGLPDHEADEKALAEVLEMQITPR